MCANDVNCLCSFFSYVDSATLKSKQHWDEKCFEISIQITRQLTSFGQKHSSPTSLEPLNIRQILRWDAKVKVETLEFIQQRVTLCMHNVISHIEKWNPVSCSCCKHSLIPLQCAHEKILTKACCRLCWRTRRTVKQRWQNCSTFYLFYLFKVNFVEWKYDRVFPFKHQRPHVALDNVAGSSLHFPHQLALQRCTFFSPIQCYRSWYSEHLTMTVALGVQHLIACTHLALNARS